MDNDNTPQDNLNQNNHENDPNLSEGEHEIEHNAPEGGGAQAVQFLLDQLRINPIGEELFDLGGDNISVSSEEGFGGIGTPDAEEDGEPFDFSKYSTCLFIEPALAVRYPVRTNHYHHQLLNLCELTADESGLYVCSFDPGLDEIAYKKSIEDGTPYTEPTAAENPYSDPSLRKFDFATKKLFNVPQLTLSSIYCIGSKYGYVAINDSGTVQIMHEATGKLVEGEFKETGNWHQTNNVFFGLMKKPNGEDQVVLLVSRNGGEIALYDLNQEGDRFVSTLRQHINVKWNINHSAFGFFEFGKYLIGAPDYAEGPIIYKMDENENFALVETFLTFPRPQTSAMMGSWQAQGPLFAMATESGQCIVWDFPARERVKVLLSCAEKAKLVEKERLMRENPEGGEPQEAEDDESRYFPQYGECVRIAKFNPVPLFNYVLVFAESNYFLHIVDTRTWDEQIIQVESSIHGLCFSSDGRKLYVAYGDHIAVYELILRTSLLETCLHYIRHNIAKKEEHGWNLDALPYDLQFKLNY